MDSRGLTVLVKRKWVSRMGRCCPIPPGGLFVQSLLGTETETRGRDETSLARLYLTPDSDDGESFEEERKVSISAQLLRES